MSEKNPPLEKGSQAPEAAPGTDGRENVPPDWSGAAGAAEAARDGAAGNWMTEADLAAVWGVSRDRLKELRPELEEGSDWRRDFRVIEYSEAGAARARALLEERLKSWTDDGKGPLPKENTPPGRARAVVTKIWRNERLLQADVAGVSSRVRVRTNENFVPGMSMEVIHEHDDVWRYEGRLPRRKGGW